MSDDIGPLFMERTKYRHLEPSAQSQGLPQPPLERSCASHAPAVALPKPADVAVGRLDLRQAIERRRSVRRYSAEPLSPEELSFLLWCTQGVQQVMERQRTVRTVPSAGARHAFDTHLLVNRVTGLPPGLYRYLALAHSLCLLDARPEVSQEVTAACLGQGMVQTSAVTFVWVAVVERMRWRYGQRGYRYLHLDAGHVCQNLYLATQAVGAGACAIGAFDDDEVNRLLDLDGTEQFAIYLAAVGKV